MPTQPLNPSASYESEEPNKVLFLGTVDNVTPETIDVPAPAPKRKRGGQPGNTNSLRHGFYARNLGQFSPRKYDETELRNLLGEAAMLKDYMFFVYNSNLGCTDSVTLADTLRALALAGVALSRVLQVHSHIRITPSSGGNHLSALLDSLDL